MNLMITMTIRNMTQATDTYNLHLTHESMVRPGAMLGLGPEGQSMPRRAALPAGAD